MKSWLRSGVLGSAVLKGAAQLFSGRVAAMAVGILAAPVIARLFTPEHYGSAAVFVAITTIAATILPAGYHRAVLFPREDRTAASLLVLSFLVSIGLLVLLYVVFAMAAILNPAITHVSGLADVFWLLPFGALLLAVRNAMNTVLLRRGAFASIATVDVGQSGVLAGSRVAWGLALGSTAAGLVWGHIASLIVAMLLSWRVCGPWLKDAAPTFSGRELLGLAAEYKDYPLMRVFAQLAFMTATQLPILALGVLFSPAIVGFYAMADRVAGLPLLAASHSLSGAILRKSIGERHQDRPVSPAIWKAALALTLVGIPTFSAMFLLGGDILTWILGARWYEAGEMLEILSLLLFAQWVTSAFSPVLETLRANRLHLFLNSTNLLMRAATFAACYFAGMNVYAVLWVFVTVTCAHYAIFIAATILLMQRHDRQLAKSGS